MRGRSKSGYNINNGDKQEQIKTAKELISLVENYVAKLEENKMSKLYIFLADGFEEIEGLTVVDVLRRAGVEVTMVSVMGKKNIVGAHHITLEADALFEECDFSDGDMFVLPGGMPGTLHLGEHQYLAELLKKADQEKKGIAAICAAPSVFSGLGFLKGRKATSYPSFMEVIAKDGAQTSEDSVVVDGNITTSRGLGTAVDFALSLIAQLENDEKAKEIAESVVYSC